MYERRFGTDWDALAVEEIIERAYALGVQTVLAESPELDDQGDASDVGSTAPDDGVDPDVEVERLTGELSGYDRSIVDLAYEEGRTEALERRTHAGTGRELWDELVAEEAFEVPDRDEKADGDVATDDPDAPVTRPDLLERYLPDGREATSLPQFLTRD